MHEFLLTFIVVLMLSFTLEGNTFEGKIYKWTDKEGKIHFSDKPPTDQSVKVEEQKVDTSKLTITSMPRSQRQMPLTASQCQSAIDNLKHTGPIYRGELVKKLAKKDISDEEFAQGLAKLDALKGITNPDSCRKAQPEDRALLHCIAQNKDATNCIQ